MAQARSLNESKEGYIWLEALILKSLNIRRQVKKIEEFPSILGRNFSGFVVKTG